MVDRLNLLDTKLHLVGVTDGQSHHIFPFFEFSRRVLQTRIFRRVFQDMLNRMQNSLNTKLHFVSVTDRRSSQEKFQAPQQYAASKLITAPHVAAIRTQSTFMPEPNRLNINSKF